MKKKRPTSIQVPDPLDQRVSEAMELTGESFNSLVVECTDRFLDVVVADIMARKKEKLMAFYDKEKKPRKR